MLSSPEATLDQPTVSHRLLLHHREACGFTGIWFLLSLCIYIFGLPLYPDVNCDKGHRQTQSGQESSNSSEGRGHELLELGPFCVYEILRS